MRFITNGTFDIYATEAASSKLRPVAVRCGNNGLAV